MNSSLARPWTGAGRLQHSLAAPLRLQTALVASALGLAAIVRLAFVLASDFPLNDGGLFLVMVEDMKASGPFPAFTTYNGGHLPFAYPPLAFWLTALLDAAGPWSALDLVRVLPVVFSVATVGAAWLLFRRLSPSVTIAAIATLLFAVVPRGFNWEIVGGGLTRSLGLLLAVLALERIAAYCQEGRPRVLAGLALLWGLTILAHPQMGWFVAYIGVLIVLFRGRTVAQFGGLVLAGLGALLLATPWWLSVLIPHGSDPLLSAAQTGGNTWYGFLTEKVVRLEFTEEPYLPLIAVLGLVGFAFALVRGDYLLPAWLLAVFLLDPRKASTLATFPVAILAARALVDVISPALARTPGRPVAGAFLVGGVVLYGGWSALDSDAMLSSPLHALSHDSRAAMDWVEHRSEDDARFVVVRGTHSPWTDEVSEWFPALAARASVATVQGYEWAGVHAYDGQLALYDQVQACAGRTETCLERVLGNAGKTFTHVYLVRSPSSGDSPGNGCCSRLRASLLRSDDYRLVYDGDGATIFERREEAG